MIFVGIDPGILGGIAMINERGDAVRVTKMPVTDHDVLAFLTDTWRDGLQIRAVLERVSASPQMGVVSAFTFGKTAPCGCAWRRRGSPTRRLRRRSGRPSSAARAVAIRT